MLCILDVVSLPSGIISSASNLSFSIDIVLLVSKIAILNLFYTFEVVTWVIEPVKFKLYCDLVHSCVMLSARIFVSFTV